MDMENDRQSEAQRKVQALLKSAEEVRRQKRLNYGVAELALGNLDLLKNDELAAALPDYLVETVDDEGIATGVNLLQRLGEASRSRDRSMRSRAITILSLTIERIAASENSMLLVTLLDTLVAWLRQEEELLPGSEVLVGQIAQLGADNLAADRFEQAGEVFSVLREISSGEREKRSSIRSLTSKALLRVVAPPLLARLLDRLRVEDEEGGQRLEKMLVLLGKPAATQALSLLDRERDEEMRRRLMRLLTAGGRVSATVFEEQMAIGASPVLRKDMLQILSAMEDDGVFPLLEQNLHHEDTLVQREAVEAVIEPLHAKQDWLSAALAWHLLAGLRPHTFRDLPGNPL